MRHVASNLLLSSLGRRELGALQPHLKTVKFEQAQILHEAGDRISGVYFPFDAIVSLVVILKTGESIEAAMVGPGRRYRSVLCPRRQAGTQSRDRSDPRKWRAVRS
jgi:hypothetical protein